MGFYQKSNSESNTSFLKVNPNTYARLVEETNEAYVFNIYFKVTSESNNRRIQDYEKVLVSVRSKVSDEDLSSYANSIESNQRRKINIVPLSGPRLSNGKRRPRYPEKISNRLYSNIKLLEGIQQPDDFLAMSEVILSDFLPGNKNQIIFETELFTTRYKNSQLSSVNSRIDRRFSSIDSLGSVKVEDRRGTIDVSNLVFRMNSSVCDVTQPIHEEKFRKLNSRAFSDLSLSSKFSSNKRDSFLFDLTKYYLTEVIDSPDSDNVPHYEVRKVAKEVNEFDITTRVRIRKVNKNSNLIVKFDLLQKDCSLTEETVLVDLYLSNHIEASNSITSPPVVNCLLKNMSPGRESQGNYLNFLTIIDKDTKGKIDSFAIYLKNIYSNGTSSSYKKIGNVVNTGTCNFEFSSETKLSIVRVVPVDKDGKESNIFTNIAVGPGYDRVDRLVIVPQNLGINQIRIDVFNIPENTVILTLYRRDCTDSFNSPFKFSTEIRTDQNSKFATIVDDNTELDKVYEYYVVALVVDQDSFQEDAVVSNFGTVRNIVTGTIKKTVTVDIQKPTYSSDENGPKASFNIKTIISPEENERITSTLKSLLGEMYEQYLNPSSNSASPLGEDSKGVPRYSDLFFHQVVRNNLVTGEREIFDLSSDGLFEDKSDTQKIFNIQPLNRSHTYLYQVFTYKKNPIELFKKFVARGIDEKGREWFYLPYKWKNPKIRIGKLYADDNEGIPVIDAYDNFTSESFGITATHRLRGPDAFESSEKKATFNRVDIKTIKVEWDSENYNDSSYDSFVVMKVVNGVRSLLGRSRTNYIYHSLTEEDLGSVYYIIVPVMSDFVMSYPRYTGYLLVSPEGLTEKTLLPQTMQTKI